MRTLFCRVLFVLFLFGSLFAADSPRLIRSLSGPSGKVVGSKFVFDETRSRFVYPQDQTLTIYFEWEAPAGDHVLSANWKQPDGRVVSISPDVKVQTQNSFLSCYWVFIVVPDYPDGIWTVDVRLDGQPAGSYSFELAGLPGPHREPPPTPEPPKQPTLDEVYRTTGPSVVWVYKIDETGRRVDESSGFVWAPGVIATAFQSIDSAASLQVEFAGGRKTAVETVLACSRLGDWALLKVDTGSASPLARGKPQDVAVGERLIVFNVEGNARVIGGVDITARQSPRGFGERIRISPPPATEAAGGPLLNVFGQVVGIVGGCITPGARFPGHAMNVSSGVFNSFNTTNAAVPISVLADVSKVGPQTLADLRNEGMLTSPVNTMSEFLYGSTSSTLSKYATDPLPPTVSDFTPHDSQVYVYSLWVRRGKLSKGEISGSVYDATNHLLVRVPPKKITLRDSPTRVAFSFSPAPLPPGIYRVDLNWDGKPAWRTFVRIMD
jgi:hypothetical protein